MNDVDRLFVQWSGEVYPTENQRKRDRDRQQTSPEDELVHYPTQTGTLLDERLGKNMGGCCGQHAGETANRALLPKQFPPTAPINFRRGLLDPDVVVVDDAPGGKN